MSARVALVAVAVATLCACTSTTSGTPSGGGSGSAAPADTHGFPSDGAGLAALLAKPGHSIRTAHVTVTTSLHPGTTITDIDEVFTADGRLAAFHSSGGLHGTPQVEEIVLGGTSYLKLPAVLQPPGLKPWLDVTHGAKNPTVAEFAKGIPASAAVTDPRVGYDVVRAQQYIRFLSIVQLNGAEVARYAVTADVRKLPAALATPARTAGLTSLPFEIYVDKQGVLRELRHDQTTVGVRTTSLIAFTRVNQRVRITAPPASQVGLG